MPCRALEAFRPSRRAYVIPSNKSGVLMPCRALEAFRPKQAVDPPDGSDFGLNALSGIGGVQTVSKVIRLVRAAYPS